jgi:hypothetical protein
MDYETVPGCVIWRDPVAVSRRNAWRWARHCVSPDLVSGGGHGGASTRERAESLARIYMGTPRVGGGVYANR